MSGEIFDGDTLESALAKAAEKLGTAPENLRYEVLQEGTKDFWGLDEQFVRIRAWLPEEGEAAPEVPPAAPEAPPTAPEVPPAAGEAMAPEARVPGEPPDPRRRVGGLVERILAAMGFRCEVRLEEGDDALYVLISGDDTSYLLEGGGRALTALEMILNHAFRRLEGIRKIRVDAGDFRSRREEELRDLAYQVAHSAKQTGRTQETQPLNPYERRLVHLALADDPEVTTRSRGSGFLKHVQVIPRRGRRG